MNRKIPAWLLIVLAVVILALPMSLGIGKDAEEPYAGTDSSAETLVEEEHQGYEAWFEPLIGELPGEVESGLFALQAALGAGLLGYVLGNYRGRQRTQDQSHHPASQ